MNQAFKKPTTRDYIVLSSTVKATDGKEIYIQDSLGLKSFGLGDFYMYGVMPEIGTAIVNEAISLFWDGKIEFDKPFEIEGFSCKFMLKSISPEQSVHRLGHTTTNLEPRSLIQVVWSNEQPDGFKFPWEPGFDETERKFQIELWNF